MKSTMYHLHVYDKDHTKICTIADKSLAKISFIMREKEKAGMYTTLVKINEGKKLLDSQGGKDDSDNLLSM